MKSNSSGPATGKAVAAVQIGPLVGLPISLRAMRRPSPTVPLRRRRLLQTPASTRPFKRRPHLLVCHARPGASMLPEIPESPTCVAEHGPESRSHTVCAGETHAPDLGPGQDNFDIYILGPASAREVLARRDTEEGRI